MKKDYLISAGRFIKLFRIRNELTQEQLAEIVDMHVSYISGLERGVRNPSFLVLAKLSKALNFSLDTMLLICTKDDTL